MWLKFCSWLAAVLWEASFPQHCEAVERVPPSTHSLPICVQVFQRQVHRCQGRVLAGECAPRLDRLAQAHVQIFDGVVGINDLADLWRELEERDNPQPVSSPRRADRWESTATTLRFFRLT